jgi:hypothetical protein
VFKDYTRVLDPLLAGYWLNRANNFLLIRFDRFRAGEWWELILLEHLTWTMPTLLGCGVLLSWLFCKLFPVVD